MHKHSVCYVCSGFFFFFSEKKKKKKRETKQHSVHLTLTEVAAFSLQALLVRSRTGSFQKAAAIQLSYGKWSIIQGQQ